MLLNLLSFGLYLNLSLNFIVFESGELYLFFDYLLRVFFGILKFWSRFGWLFMTLRRKLSRACWEISLLRMKIGIVEEDWWEIFMVCESFSLAIFNLRILGCLLWYSELITSLVNWSYMDYFWVSNSPIFYTFEVSDIRFPFEDRFNLVLLSLETDRFPEFTPKLEELYPTKSGLEDLISKLELCPYLTLFLERLPEFKNNELVGVNLLFRSYLLLIFWLLLSLFLVCGFEILVLWGSCKLNEVFIFKLDALPHILELNWWFHLTGLILFLRTMTNPTIHFHQIGDHTLPPFHQFLGRVVVALLLLIVFEVKNLLINRIITLEPRHIRLPHESLSLFVNWLLWFQILQTHISRLLFLVLLNCISDSLMSLTDFQITFGRLESDWLSLLFLVKDGFRRLNHWFYIYSKNKEIN